MHNGSVMVDSRLHEGSIFTVEIPDQLQPSEEKPISSGEKTLKSTATILVTEDNPEFRTFLHHELSEHYQVITASNGKDGLQKVREQHPVLVITDVMMPEMSGTEMCAQIKSDVLISHIPVILLTAKSSEHSRVEGFKARADAYITKPFNMDLLLMRIQNLIEQQEHRKKLFRKEININPGKITITNIDEELIRTALEHIERNMENSSYSVEQLSKEMFMDRTSLYRKIVAIAGQTPTEFIRSVRLKRAAQLLKDGLPVAEVSEQVGFGTTSYFTKCFQDEFGIKPSHFKKA